MLAALLSLTLLISGRIETTARSAGPVAAAFQNGSIEGRVAKKYLVDLESIGRIFRIVPGAEKVQNPGVQILAVFAQSKLLPRSAHPRWIDQVPDVEIRGGVFDVALGAIQRVTTWSAS